MRTIEIERAGNAFRVTWMQGIQAPKSRLFDSRADAETFANKKMGARGYVVSTLDMTPEQLAEDEARKARSRAFLATLARARPMDAPSPFLNKPLRSLEQARADLAAPRAPRMRFYVRFDNRHGDDDVASEWATDPATAYEQFNDRPWNVRCRNIVVDPVPDAIMLRDGTIGAIDRVDGLKIMLAQSVDATRRVA